MSFSDIACIGIQKSRQKDEDTRGNLIELQVMGVIHYG